MRDLEISLDADRDWWMFESLDCLILNAEDEAGTVSLSLTDQQAEQIYEWLKTYLKK
jgi:hypothetical protein